LFPTKYFLLELCIPEWITAPPLPWRIHWSARGYTYSLFAAVSPVA
jgi:hypothetical protein